MRPLNGVKASIRPPSELGCDDQLGDAPRTGVEYLLYFDKPALTDDCLPSGRGAGTVGGLTANTEQIDADEGCGESGREHAE